MLLFKFKVNCVFGVRDGVEPSPYGVREKVMSSNKHKESTKNRLPYVRHPHLRTCCCFYWLFLGFIFQNLIIS